MVDIIHPESGKLVARVYVKIKAEGDQKLNDSPYICGCLNCMPGPIAISPPNLHSLIMLP